MTGWIASDIDGTLTAKADSIPLAVVDYLRSLQQKGWNILISTGRSYTYALRVLHQLDFPYHLSVQNGTALFKMPEKTTLFTRYLSFVGLEKIERAMEGKDGIIVAYSGHLQNDQCFWKKNVSLKYQEYLKELMKRSGQLGIEVENFTSLPFEMLSLIKCIGPHSEMNQVAEKLKLEKSFSFSLVRDSFYQEFSLLLITRKGVHKGSALQKIIKKTGSRGKIIVAGNDGNDLGLFIEGSFKIAMENSCPDLLAKADFIAPRVEEMGILKALEHAIDKT